MKDDSEMKQSPGEMILEALKEIVEERGPSPEYFLNALVTSALLVTGGGAKESARTAIHLMFSYVLHWPEHAKACERWIDGLDAAAGNEALSADLAELLGEFVEACPVSVILEAD